MTAQPSRSEFIAMIAMMFATIAFSIDAMLPALPRIADTFSPDAPNQAQLVITSFVLGMGVGTLFTGPLSDSFGRKPVVIWGAVLYILSTVVAIFSPSLEGLLMARMVQGIAAAAPRVVALAVVRDNYEGRQMAQIMSIVMIVFALVPALAPSLGAVIIHFGGWRAVFWSFLVFSVISTLWFLIRQPETHPVEKRRPFRAGTIWSAINEMFAHPIVRLAIYVQAMGYGMLFAAISTIQPIYEHSFDRAESFPLWFALTAVMAMSSSYLNSKLVIKLGMQRMVRGILTVNIIISTTVIALQFTQIPLVNLFPAFLLWQMIIFFQAGIVLGNLNALAMEPMGHIAGMAASVIGAIGTVAGVALAAPIGLMFDGTPLPLTVGALLLALIGRYLMHRMAQIPIDR